MARFSFSLNALLPLHTHTHKAHTRHTQGKMAFRLVLVAFLLSLLFLHVVFYTRVEWRKLPTTFSQLPSLLLRNESSSDEDMNASSRSTPTILATNDTTITTITTTPYWHALASPASRVWQSPTAENYSWCIPQKSQQHYVRARNVRKIFEVEGIIFIKSPKAASSTGAGISLRIAHELGNRLYNTSCTVNYTHSFSFFRGHAKRSPTCSLLWTIVREPALRQLSIYNFFFLARKGINTTTVSPETINNFMATHKSGQFRYIATRKMTMSALEHKSPKQQQQLVSKLLQHYHFIAISERMDESLVAMKLLFGLQHADLIVLPSKVGYDFQTCRPVPILKLTTDMTDFIQTNFTVNNIDYLLYEAVNLSLDRTIQQLGHDFFHAQLQEHKRLQALAERQCLFTTQPCSKNHMWKEECYAGDSGCGYKCVNHVLELDAKKRRSDG